MGSCFPQYWAPAELSYFTAIFSLVLCLVTSTGNLLIVVAVLVDPLRKLRTPFSYFLVNLAVSDFIVGAITMPVSVDIHMSETRGYIADFKIKLLHMSYFVSATSSVFSLGALSLDRYVAIRWPIRYRMNLSLTRCLIISTFIWLFSIGVSMVYLGTGYIDFLMVFAHVSVVTTLVLLIFTYQQVYKSLRAQTRQLRAVQNTIPNREQGQDSNDEQSNELRSVRNEKKITRAFLYIVGLFFCSYVPAIIMIYILQFCNTCNCNVRHVLRDLQFLLVSTNSAMNPFVCTIRLGNFRRSIIALFRRPKRENSTTQTARNRGYKNSPIVSRNSSTDNQYSNEI
eukprot:gene8828-9773_t